jgi:hypothetical protein
MMTALGDRPISQPVGGLVRVAERTMELRAPRPNHVEMQWRTWDHSG